MCIFNLLKGLNKAQCEQLVCLLRAGGLVALLQFLIVQIISEDKSWSVLSVRKRWSSVQSEIQHSI